MPYPTNAEPIFSWGRETGRLVDLKADLGLLIGPMVIYADVTAQIDGTGLTPLTKGPTRGLFVDQAGTLTGHDAFGTAVTAIKLQAGYNPISIGGITSVTSITQIIGVW